MRDGLSGLQTPAFPCQVIPLWGTLQTQDALFPWTRRRATCYERAADNALICDNQPPPPPPPNFRMMGCGLRSPSREEG